MHYVYYLWRLTPEYVWKSFLICVFVFKICETVDKAIPYFEQMSFLEQFASISTIKSRFSFRESDFRFAPILKDTAQALVTTNLNLWKSPNLDYYLCNCKSENVKTGKNKRNT